MAARTAHIFAPLWLPGQRSAMIFRAEDLFFLAVLMGTRSCRDR
jgi:hypothetical protein